MRNLESKFACPDHERVRALALDIGASEEGFIEQTDRFYKVAHGKLKLRLLGEQGELIAYTREDRAEARSSEYFIYVTDTPRVLRGVLNAALGRGTYLEEAAASLGAAPHADSPR